MSRARTKLLCTTLLVTGLVAGFAPFAPTLVVAPAQAQQRVEVREEFRVALEPHGRFERHSRFGEVWRPTRVAKDWRPYTVGRWVYTEDLGWYWNSDQTEADWGWIAFHYGRWVDDREMGWVWVAGNEWGPAWVNWRRGEGPAIAARGARPSNRSGDAEARYIGWAPLAPDDVQSDYAENPNVWIFVRARDFVAPRVSTVIIRERRPDIFERTVLVNRTVIVRDRGVNVNPGIPPAYVAAFIGRPIVSYEVRPRVIAGTTRVSNAIEFRTEDLRDTRRMQRDRVVIRETRTRIEAVRDVPAPRALEANEAGGRLGERPPRAAQAPGEQRPGAPDPRGSATDRNNALPGQTGTAPGRPGETPGQARTAPGRAGETPGQAGTAPGRAGDTPGQAGNAPGRAGDTPGQARTAPGRPGDTPGQAGTAPGRAGDTPGQARTAPGRSGETPGQAGKAPGRAGDTPGQAGTAPGRAGDTPGQARTAPGRSGDTPGQAGTAPGRAADGPARQQERGVQQREERSQPQQRPERTQGAPERTQERAPERTQERVQERTQERAQERSPAPRTAEPASPRAAEPGAPPRGGREGVTGAAPNRGDDAERAPRAPRPQDKPEAQKRPGQPE